mmetsp:Transcript_4688/g.15123  ORF Transcript_4688/g.15123 Transcript_4688/m.15123 type:complete len:219 (+) Transcript_4688:378-1034(+)
MEVPHGARHNEEGRGLPAAREAVALVRRTLHLVGVGRRPEAPPTLGAVALVALCLRLLQGRVRPEALVRAEALEEAVAAVHLRGELAEVPPHRAPELVLGCSLGIPLGEALADVGAVLGDGAPDLQIHLAHAKALPSLALTARGALAIEGRLAEFWVLLAVKPARHVASLEVRPPGGRGMLHEAKDVAEAFVGGGNGGAEGGREAQADQEPGHRCKRG